MKNNYLYFGIFLITFAAKTSAMEQSGCSELEKLEALQNQVKQGMITRSKETDLLSEFSNVDLTKINKDLEDLKKAKRCFPSLFEDQCRRLDILSKSVVSNNSNGKATVVAIVAGQNGTLKIFSDDTNATKLLKSIDTKQNTLQQLKLALRAKPVDEMGYALLLTLLNKIDC